MSKKDKYQLTVTQRLVMAEQAFVKEYPGKRLTVAKLAILAGVNRSNIYTSHGEIVKRLSLVRNPEKENTKLRPQKAVGSNDKTPEDCSDYKSLYKAMLVLNIELNAELAAVKVRLEEKVRALNARRRR